MAKAKTRLTARAKATAACGGLKPHSVSVIAQNPATTEQSKKKERGGVMRDEQMKALSDRLKAIRANDTAIRARVAAMRREREESEQMIAHYTPHCFLCGAEQVWTDCATCNGVGNGVGELSTELSTGAECPVCCGQCGYYSCPQEDAKGC